MSELFRLKILTPERIFFEGEVDFIEYATIEGRVGIYAGHEPMTELLSPGVLYIHNGDMVKKAALHAGFAKISADKVDIMAQIAEWPEEIDKNRAEEAKIRAERRISDAKYNRDRAELALRRAIARIETIEN